jgi:hypothetical protein
MIYVFDSETSHRLLQALMTNQLPAASIQCLQISFSSQTTLFVMNDVITTRAAEKIIKDQIQT